MTRDNAVYWARRIERNRHTWTAEMIVRTGDNGLTEYGVCVTTSGGRRVDLWTLNEIDSFLYRA